MKELSELPIKPETQGSSQVKLRLQNNPREFASKLDAAFEQLPSMATDFSGFSVMNSGKTLYFWSVFFHQVKNCFIPSKSGVFLLMGFEELFSKKPLWDVVRQAVQTELGAVKTKPIKNNLRKESTVNRNDKKSSEDVSHNSMLPAPRKCWFLKRPSRLDELLREYSKSSVDNTEESFKKPNQFLNLEDR